MFRPYPIDMVRFGGGNCALVQTISDSLNLAPILSFNNRIWLDAGNPIDEDDDDGVLGNTNCRVKTSFSLWNCSRITCECMRVGAKIRWRWRRHWSGMNAKSFADPETLLWCVYRMTNIVVHFEEWKKNLIFVLFCMSRRSVQLLFILFPGIRYVSGQILVKIKSLCPTVMLTE